MMGVCLKHIGVNLKKLIMCQSLNNLINKINTENMGT